jgi:TonB family protein
VPIRQELPKVPKSITSQANDRGRLEIVIDEKGRVVEITVRKSVHPLYDTQVMAAARTWRYRPAVAAGVPVKFRKLIEILVDR